MLEVERTIANRHQVVGARPENGDLRWEGRSTLQVYHDAEAFRRDTFEYLARHEAANNLLFGILAQLSVHSQDAPPYLSLCRDGDDIDGVAIRTPPMNLLLAYQTAPRALEELAADLAARSPDLPGVLGERGAAADFADMWRLRTGCEHALQMAERIYELTAVIAPPVVSGQMRRADSADEPLLLDWIRAFQVASGASGDPARALKSRLVRDPLQGGMYIWEDGGPVAIAGYAGRTPTGIRVGPVYTPPALRGHGYATALVAALSQELLLRGMRRVFLFTDLANKTANDIYRRIGYRPVADVDQIRFL